MRSFLGGKAQASAVTEEVVLVKRRRIAADASDLKAFCLRMPLDLHDQVMQQAKSHGQPMNLFIVDLLAMAVAR